MLLDIVFVKPRKKYLLYLKFEDGFSGVIDLERMIPFEGVFEKLKEWEYFQLVKVDMELGTIVWPNGADLDPVVLYEEIRKRKISKKSGTEQCK
jgi:hypothetical protein